MTAPVLRLAPPGASITRPFLTLPAQQPHPAAGPQQDIARRKGVASSRFAFELPDLCKCRGRMMDEAYCSPASPTPQVVHVPHILLGPAPSISARLTYEVLAATDALHPRWLGETMVAPVLEVPRSGSHTAGVATVVPPIPDVLPPEFLYRKEEVAISPTPSTACCLNHLCARKPRCVEQADQNVSDLIEVLRYLEQGCPRIPPFPSDGGLPMIMPHRSAFPPMRRPRHPFATPPAPVLEAPTANPVVKAQKEREPEAPEVARTWAFRRRRAPFRP